MNFVTPFDVATHDRTPANLPEKGDGCGAVLNLLYNTPYHVKLVGGLTRHPTSRRDQPRTRQLVPHGTETFCSPSRTFDNNRLSHSANRRKPSKVRTTILWIDNRHTLGTRERGDLLVRSLRKNGIDCLILPIALIPDSHNRMILGPIPQLAEN